MRIFNFSRFISEAINPGLLGSLRDLGLSLSEDEQDMLDFINQFGGDKSPTDYADGIYDYYTNPEEYGIDEDSDYYDMTWYLYENSVMDAARFNLGGTMRLGNYNRWDKDIIENNEHYQLYKKMSSYYNKAK